MRCLCLIQFRNILSYNYMPKYCDMREAYKKHNKEKEFDMTIDNICEYLMRQTDYDYKTTLEKLIQHNMNTIDVIREWIGKPNINSSKLINKSNNQLVFDEFRKFLDEASGKYYKSKHDKDIKNNDDWVKVEPTNEIITHNSPNNICL